MKCKGGALKKKEEQRPDISTKRRDGGRERRDLGSAWVNYGNCDTCIIADKGFREKKPGRNVDTLVGAKDLVL